MRNKRTILFCLIAIGIHLSFAQNESLEVMSPQEIWEGYDPRKEPLEEEVLKTWEKDGVVYKEVYFNGENFDGEYVRIYAKYAAPKGKTNLPAILHIHGGGQSVNGHWLDYWGKQGYAVLSFNWGGEWTNRKRYTLWKGVENGDHLKRKGTRITTPSPRSDAYFLWTQASMRAITYLENQKEVNKDKIGLFGVSMGGSIMWNIAFDQRVKAGCAIYGAGFNTHQFYDPRYAIDFPAKAPSENDLRWRKSLAPEASAPFVHFPMLFLSGSNDHHGDMDRAQDALDLIPSEVDRAWALTPGYRHHVGADFVHNLPRWMDFHLNANGYWPKNPTSAIEIGKKNIPQFTLTPDQAKEVSKVVVYYALENPFSINRHWQSIDVAAKGASFQTSLPVMNADEYLYAFANITYKNGVVLSSRLEAVIPSTLGNVKTIKEPSRVIYEGEEGLGSWVVNSSGTDPIPEMIEFKIKVATGPQGKKGISPMPRYKPWIFAPGNPQFRAPKGASLSFEVYTNKDQDFNLRVHKNYRVNGFQTFEKKVHLNASSEWQTITVASNEFVNVKTGKSLEQSINEVNTIDLNLDAKAAWAEGIIFRNFQWVGGEYVPSTLHAYRGAKQETQHITELHSSDDAKHLVDHEAMDRKSIIENLITNSAHEYKLASSLVQNGVRVWTDRPYVITRLPKELEGATLLQSPMEDRAAHHKELISFSLTAKASVFVGLKKGNKVPEWMQNWDETSYEAKATNDLIFYKKDFTKGENVSLGSLKGTGSDMMYTIFVKQ